MKTKKSLTSRQRKLIKTDKWIKVFNEIHNEHLSTNVGQVVIKTYEKKNYSKTKKQK